MSEKIGRTEGFASINLLKGFSILGIKARKGVGKVKAYNPAKRVDHPEDEYTGDFEYDFLPSSRHKLPVDFIKSKKSYWNAERKVLDQIIEELRLRYPRNHKDKAGQEIKTSDPKNYYDDFFQTIIADIGYGRFIEGGTILLDLSDPLDRLYFYLIKGSPKSIIKGDTSTNKYIAENAVYEIVLPEQEKKVKDGIANKTIKAIALLDPEKGLSLIKMRLIAYIMGLKGINYQTATEQDVRTSLYAEAAMSEKVSKFWGEGNSAQDFFIALSKLSNETLQVRYEIKKAINYNIIVKRNKKYEFDNEVIGGDNPIISEQQLIDFLTSDSNSEIYNSILDKIENVDQLKGVK